MSQYQHGYSGYYGQANVNNNATQRSQSQSHAHLPQSGPYTPPENSPNPQHPLRRVPSYMAGDDQTYFDEQQPQGFGITDPGLPYNSSTMSTVNQYSYAQNSQNNQASRLSHVSHGSSLHSRPSRASSHGSSTVSAYAQAYQPSVSNSQPYQHPPLPHSQSQPAASTYNPQAYAPYVTATQSYQPYTPATYQQSYSYYGSPHLPGHPTTTSSGFASPPPVNPYATPSPSNPPPVPPRAPDHPYGIRNPPLSPQQNPTASSDTGGSYSSPYLSQSSFTETQSSAPSRQYSHSLGSGTLSHGSNYGTNPSVAPYRRDNPPPPPVHSSYGESNYDTTMSSHHPPYGASAPSPSNTSVPHRTDTLTRHPTLRPLPGPPPEDDHLSESSPHPPSDVLGTVPISDDHMGSDELIRQLEADLTPRQHSMRQSQSRRHSRGGSIGNYSHGHEGPINRATPSEPVLPPNNQQTYANGSAIASPSGYKDYDHYSDDSEVEAAAGLRMLREAEGEGLGPSATLFGRSRLLASVPTITAHDGGHGWAGNNSYQSTQVGLLQNESALNSDAEGGDGATSGLFSNSASRRTSNRSTEGRLPYSEGGDGASPIVDEPQLPLPPLPYPSPAKARVDRGGTGGLSEPGSTGRRMSFDDEDEDRSGDQSPERGGEPADLFFHPGMRPLPPAPLEPENVALRSQLIPAGTYLTPQPGGQPPHGLAPYPTLQESPYAQPEIGLSPVPRSTSLVSHSSSPRKDPPIRSKTDADRAKHKQVQELSRTRSSVLGFSALPGTAEVGLSLPTIPAGRRKKFNPGKMSAEQYNSCSEPWALSSVVSWIKELSEDETYLREQSVIDAIVALFTHKVPTMNIADAETLSARVVKTMLDEGVLITDEEWVRFTNESLSGVLFQITGKGCYSSQLHEVERIESLGRCYSHHCMRTLKKVNLRTDTTSPQMKVQDWVSFYNVTKEMLALYSKKEIDRQNNLHEIVTTEDAYIGQLDILRKLYRDQLASTNPPIISPKRLSTFLNSVFGKVDAVKRVNEEYLLAQLKYRQKEQGPFITGFSDIFREWIRKAKAAYIDYAATFPRANYLVRQEAERNIPFRTFLNQVRENPLSNRLSWDTFLKAPITRIQRYTLLLSTVQKNMLKDLEEKANLEQAIEEIKVVALECDAKVGEMSKKIDLKELGAKLKLRPEMKNEVELNLEHLGRQVIYKGDLQRPGNRTRFNIVDTHAILFDHYLVLAKLAVDRDANTGLKVETYDVSKLPIPMDLLVLESTNDDLVVKSAVRGISPLTPAAAATALGGNGPGTLVHTNTSSTTASTGTASGKTLQPVTLDTTNDKILYPFKVKHLGKEGSYTLFAHSAHSRQEWCEKIIEAKTKHAASLFAQNAEPFRIRVLADAAFAFSESPGPKTVTIRGTPLDRAIKDVEEKYTHMSRPLPSCRAAVNCATTFQQPPGQLKCAIGTDYGLWISDYNDPRGWVKALPITKVTQIAVFEEFNIMLVISDKSLIAYHLDVVVPISGISQSSQQDSARRAPQKLSGSREVGFFAAGRMKDRTLIIYKKKDGITSKFKVLEPVLQRGSNSRSRFLPARRGRTDFFRDYGDEFYIPAESYNINLFHSSLAISTNRGMEILTLEVKNSFSIPVLQSSSPDAQKYLTSIGNRIKDLRPLGMFRLSESEFLVAYTECAVYISSTGDISRGVIMEFVGQAHTACLYGRFLVLLNDDFVEVRNAENGRLRQVIPGRNVVCLDDGGNMAGSGSSGLHASSFAQSNGVSSTAEYARTGRTVKIAMQHPEYERSQVIIELIENEGQVD